MSDNIKHIDVDSDEFEDAPKALRDHVKKLQTALTTVTTERDDVRGKLASRAVGDVLSGQGFKNPKRVERDLLADNIDPHDSAAVETWLTANGDDYAKGDPAATATAEEQPGEPLRPGAELGDEGENFQKLNLGQEFKTPAGLSKIEAAKAEITPDMNGQDVIKIYAKYGI